eukprot:5287042-Alexandrium_andersonii.AAC.1
MGPGIADHGRAKEPILGPGRVGLFKRHLELRISSRCDCSARAQYKTPENLPGADENPLQSADPRHALENPPGAAEKPPNESRKTPQRHPRNCQ